MTTPSEFEREEIHKILDLIVALLDESRAGSVNWSQDVDAPGEDGYHAFVGDKELFVRSRDGDGRQPFIFVLLEGGRALRSLDTSEEVTGVREDWQSLVGDLYAEARKRGRPVNRAIDEVMEELKQRQRARADDDIPF